MDKDAYISNELQVQNHSLTSFHKNNSLLSATSILFCSPAAYNTTAYLDKPTCTDYVDFGKCQNRFGRFLWCGYLDVKLKVSRKDENKEFRLVQTPTTGEVFFN